MLEARVIDYLAEHGEDVASPEAGQQAVASILGARAATSAAGQARARSSEFAEGGRLQELAGQMNDHVRDRVQALRSRTAAGVPRPGATEGLACCLFGLIEPGDEVVLIEPLYDSYLPIVRRAGAVPRLVRVEPPDWTLPRDALSAAFSDKTKLILFNSPMNPAAKVFDRDELEFIADLVTRHDAYAVCDEVYEHIAFDRRPHIPMMTLPGLRQRCVRIGSAGKTFSLTGWKVGYMTASPELLGPIAKCHQFLTFTTPPNLQRAVAYGLGKDDDYFAALAGDLQAKRDRFAAGLEK
ncbi:MAG: aminotransferase class I/II-fold pyridoxal phosphate-dependent enzyme, partial [SAR324 cluster bacterium]|nr:aminotransferase class I/II-fold pyridoxal phosphate-dependent enzyme [SAR324 cluster bacterium]